MALFRKILEQLERPVWWIAIALLSLSPFVVIFRFGYRVAIPYALIPLALLLLIGLVKKPFKLFLLLLSFTYIVMWIARYATNFYPGVALDFAMATSAAVVVIALIGGGRELSPRQLGNSFVFLSTIWFLFCLFQYFNPNSSSPIAWVTGVRNLGVYMLVIAIFTSLMVNSLKKIEQFLFIWSLLSLVAIGKALYQKIVGFDSTELYWLYNLGGYKTHILHFGLRYFSIFTDAANFGSGIAFSGVIFSIYALYVEKRALKIYYLAVAALSMYGMLISGTRGSLAVPFVAYALFALLSKKFQLMVLSGVLIFSSIFILKFTDIGNSFTYIRRMRTIFNPDDASLNVRIENQKRLRTYMWQHPFGVGIGMARPGGETYTPDPVVSTIPSDSWYVRVWMEVGIVGLLFHIFILLFTLFKGVYYSLFKLKDKRVRGIVTALVCGLAGVYTSAYSLEILGQLPNSIFIFVAISTIFISPYIDKNLQIANGSLQDG
ncbi:MAG: O-antigen ligase family protein [Bacteroidales bacterium]